jgi:hypothetical protein
MRRKLARFIRRRSKPVRVLRDLALLRASACRSGVSHHLLRIRWEELSPDDAADLAAMWWSGQLVAAKDSRWFARYQI